MLGAAWPELYFWLVAWLANLVIMEVFGNIWLTCTLDLLKVFPKIHSSNKPHFQGMICTYAAPQQPLHTMFSPLFSHSASSVSLRRSISAQYYPSKKFPGKAVETKPINLWFVTQVIKLQPCETITMKTNSLFSCTKHDSSLLQSLTKLFKLDLCL